MNWKLKLLINDNGIANELTSRLRGTEKNETEFPFNLKSKVQKRKS